MTTLKIVQRAIAIDRYVTFWCGIVVLAFIGWAWRDSVFWDSSVANRSWKVSTTRSGVSVSYVPPPASNGNWLILRFKASPTYFSQQYWPPALFAKGEEVPCGAIELKKDGSVTGPREFLDWEADMKAARSERERLRVSMRHLSVKHWSLFVPFWLILLAAVVLWVFLLFWRESGLK